MNLGLSQPAPTGWRVWMLAARPATLPAAMAPVIAGTALAAADHRLHWLAALAAMLGAVLIQIGTNLANDYFDWRSGADNDQRLGPPRVTQKGWASPRHVARAAAFAFGLAALAGVYLVFRGGWPLLTIGLLSMACGIAYTGGPLPFGYYGLGDLAVLLFFGPVAVCGTYFVQAGTVTAAVAWASVGVGAMITAILVVNNIRDRHTDRAGGKRTLAVRWGLRASRLQYTALLGVAYALLPLLVMLGVVKGGWLLPLASLPQAVRALRTLWRLDGAALNPQLGATARLALLYCALLAGGVLL